MLGVLIRLALLKPLRKGVVSKLLLGPSEEKYTLNPKNPRPLNPKAYLVQISGYSGMRGNNKLRKAWMPFSMSSGLGFRLQGLAAFYDAFSSVGSPVWIR